MLHTANNKLKLPIIQHHIMVATLNLTVNVSHKRHFKKDRLLYEVFQKHRNKTSYGKKIRKEKIALYV